MILLYVSSICLLFCDPLTAASIHQDYYNQLYKMEHTANLNSQYKTMVQPVDTVHYVDYGNLEKLQQRPVGLTCSLCVVFDEEFCRAYGIRDVDSLKITLHAIVDQASWIFRSTDWNDDGVPDNIGFNVRSIYYGWKPYKYETNEDYETRKPGIELLKLFAKLNFRNCCLGVGFTNRAFELNGLDGIAFGASNTLIGGICDHRNPREEFMTNMNVALISGRGVNKTQLSHSQVTRAFVHAVGHSFGVHAHDNEFTNPQCWGFDLNEGSASSKLSDIPKNGRYLMWTDRSRIGNDFSDVLLLQKNTLKFSGCSKSSISEILEHRRWYPNCFEFSYEPFCGNGVVEGLEMCDCGNEFECMKQTCCGSRQSRNPCSIINIKGCPEQVVLKISNVANHQAKKSL